jgi:hypothetical protein
MGMLAQEAGVPSDDEVFNGELKKIGGFVPIEQATLEQLRLREAAARQMFEQFRKD